MSMMLFLFLLLTACTAPWTIPECLENGKRPCVGECTFAADVQAQTFKTALAVKITEADNSEHCQEIISE